MMKHDYDVTVANTTAQCVFDHPGCLTGSNHPQLKPLVVFSSDVSILVLPAKRKALAYARVHNLLNLKSGI